VLGYLEGPALAIGSLVASLTPPAVSVVIEEGVFREFLGLFRAANEQKGSPARR
jgi:hypothetical protein